MISKYSHYSIVSAVLCDFTPFEDPLNRLSDAYRTYRIKRSYSVIPRGPVLCLSHLHVLGSLNLSNVASKSP